MADETWADMRRFIEPTVQQSQNDRWSIWPASVALAVVFILLLICNLPGLLGFVMVPISLLVFAVATFAILAMVVGSAVKKRPRRGASLLLALAMPYLLWSPILSVVEYAHLGLTVGFGVGQNGSATPNGHGFTAYDWSIGFAGGENTFLIHDQTDEIALPLSRQTQPADFENGFGEECAGRVRHLLGHYYVCTF